MKGCFFSLLIPHPVLNVPQEGCADVQRSPNPSPCRVWAGFPGGVQLQPLRPVPLRFPSHAPGPRPRSAMSKSAVKISSDLLSNPLCEQEPGFLEMVTAFDTAMKRMDAFNQEKVRVASGRRHRGCSGVALPLPAPSFPFYPRL